MPEEEELLAGAELGKAPSMVQVVLVPVSHPVGATLRLRGHQSLLCCAQCLPRGDCSRLSVRGLEAACTRFPSPQRRLLAARGCQNLSAAWNHLGF